MGKANDEGKRTMDIIRSKRSGSEHHLTADKLNSILKDLPDDCKIMVQQIDEEYKDSWKDTKFWVVNADSSIVGEYWQAWDAYYSEKENLLLIHLHY